MANTKYDVKGVSSLLSGSVNSFNSGIIDTLESHKEEIFGKPVDYQDGSYVSGSPVNFDHLDKLLDLRIK